MKQIKNYDEIIISSNTLVIMDIDDTIIKFKSMNKTWWKDINEYYKCIYDHITARKLAYNDWHKIIATEIPELLDESLFFDLLNRIETSNSKLILLTARDILIKPSTLKNLKDCNIDIHPDDVHHDMFKGKKIKELCENCEYSHIIFIDDLLDNILDVEKTMPNVQCYYIEHENL